MHQNQLNYNKNHMDYHLDLKKVIRNISDQTIYVDTNESLFYYLYNNGLINNKFTWSLFSEKPISDYYLIEESDIIKTFNSDLLLIEGETLEFYLSSDSNYLKIISYDKNKININKKEYELTKGFNSLKIDSNTVEIKASSKIRIRGINNLIIDCGYNFSELETINFKDRKYNHNGKTDCNIVYFSNIFRISKCQ